MAADRDHGSMNPSRRDFLRASRQVAGLSLLATQFPGLLAIAEAAAAAHAGGAPFLHLSPAEAAGLEAIAARIIPTDETPGAREAGVIHFIDQALGASMADSAGDLRAGLASLDALAAGRADGGSFATLAPAAQDELLRQVEATPFFELMHFLTVAGMFALPSYGGNRDYLGWTLLGLSSSHAWTPPFGHYDAMVAGVPFPAVSDGGGARASDQAQGHEHGHAPAHGDD
jgi:gluconate 2-dehydrogenase gamma chain